MWKYTRRRCDLEANGYFSSAAVRARPGLPVYFPYIKTLHNGEVNNRRLIPTPNSDRPFRTLPPALHRRNPPPRAPRQMATAATRPPTAPPSAAAGDVSEVELSEAGSPDLGSRSSGSGGSGRSAAEYSGWVYHLGVNSIGHEYCHLRFLVIRGKSVAMYKRDPHDHPGLVGSPVPLLSSLLALFWF